MDEQAVSVTDFLNGRGLSEEREVILKFLEEVSDEISVTVRPKGKSFVMAEFDCGAYKGSEVLTFGISNLNIFDVAFRLMNLTSGHKFKFDEAEKILLQAMKARITK